MILKWELLRDFSKFIRICLVVCMILLDRFEAKTLVKTVLLLLMRCIYLLPSNEKSVLIMAVGYPAADAKPSPMHEAHKDIDEIVKYL